MRIEERTAQSLLQLKSDETLETFDEAADRLLSDIHRIAEAVGHHRLSVFELYSYACDIKTKISCVKILKAATGEK